MLEGLLRMLVWCLIRREGMRRTTPISPRSAARWVSKYERSPLLVEGAKPVDLLLDAILVKLRMESGCVAVAVALMCSGVGVVVEGRRDMSQVTRLREDLEGPRTGALRCLAAQRRPQPSVLNHDAIRHKEPCANRDELD